MLINLDCFIHLMKWLDSQTLIILTRTDKTIRNRALLEITKRKDFTAYLFQLRFIRNYLNQEKSLATIYAQDILESCAKHLLNQYFFSTLPEKISTSETKLFLTHIQFILYFATQVFNKTEFVKHLMPRYYPVSSDLRFLLKEIESQEKKPSDAFTPPEKKIINELGIVFPYIINLNHRQNILDYFFAIDRGNNTFAIMHTLTMLEKLKPHLSPKELLLLEHKDSSPNDNPHYSENSSINIQTKLEQTSSCIENKNNSPDEKKSALLFLIHLGDHYSYRELTEEKVLSSYFDLLLKYIHEIIPNISTYDIQIKSSIHLKSLNAAIAHSLDKKSITHYTNKFLGKLKNIKNARQLVFMCQVLPLLIKHAPKDQQLNLMESLLNTINNLSIFNHNDGTINHEALRKLINSFLINLSEIHNEILSKFKDLLDDQKTSALYTSSFYDFYYHIRYSPNAINFSISMLKTLSKQLEESSCKFQLFQHLYLNIPKTERAPYSNIYGSALIKNLESHRVCNFIKVIPSIINELNTETQQKIISLLWQYLNTQPGETKKVLIQIAPLLSIMEIETRLVQNHEKTCMRSFYFTLKACTQIHAALYPNKQSNRHQFFNRSNPKITSQTPGASPRLNL